MNSLSTEPLLQMLAFISTNRDVSFVKEHHDRSKWKQRHCY